MAEMKQNLPFRPLEVRGHGVWDPERKAFYPFISKPSTIPSLSSKAGFYYYIYFISMTIYNEGDHDAGAGYIIGDSRFLLYGNIPATTAASGVGSLTTMTAHPNVLVSSLSASFTTTGASGAVIYAEIPVDISGQ